MFKEPKRESKSRVLKFWYENEIFFEYKESLGFRVSRHAKFIVNLSLGLSEKCVVLGYEGL